MTHRIPAHAFPAAWLHATTGRLVSVALALAAVLILAWRPALLDEGSPLPQRVILALLLVGLLGSVGHALQLPTARRPVSLLIDPRLAWPLLGIAALAAVAWQF